MRSRSESEKGSWPCLDPRRLPTPRKSSHSWPRCWGSNSSARMDSIHLEIRGRVQGVGFRWYVVDTARELRLAGWVKNRSDGNVELAAAGESDALARFEAAVTAGPPG